MNGPLVRLWGVPVALGLLTAAGLLSALLGDGPWDALSWVALGVPLVVCVGYGVFART